MRLVPDPVESGSIDVQSFTDLLTFHECIDPDTPQFQRHADTGSPLPVRDNLESRNRSKEPDSAEVASGTPTATSHHPALLSFAYGGPAVVDSSRHERDGGNGHGYPPDGGKGRAYPQPDWGDRISDSAPAPPSAYSKNMAGPELNDTMGHDEEGSWGCTADASWQARGQEADAISAHRQPSCDV